MTQTRCQRSLKILKCSLKFATVSLFFLSRICYVNTVCYISCCKYVRSFSGTYWILFGNAEYSCEVTACFICVRSIISRMPTELSNHPHSTKKWNFTFRTLQQMCLNPQETADLVTFTGEIFNGKLHFLCSARYLLCFH